MSEGAAVARRVARSPSPPPPGKKLVQLLQAVARAEVLASRGGKPVLVLSLSTYNGCAPADCC
eukprot:COSAG01_NODE_6892_length_3448_cov_131.689758_1_plen_63_part_00